MIGYLLLHAEAGAPSLGLETLALPSFTPRLQAAGATFVGRANASMPSGDDGGAERAPTPFERESRVAGMSLPVAAGVVVALGLVGLVAYKVVTRRKRR